MQGINSVLYVCFRYRRTKIPGKIMGGVNEKKCRATVPDLEDPDSDSDCLPNVPYLGKLPITCTVCDKKVTHLQKEIRTELRECGATVKVLFDTSEANITTVFGGRSTVSSSVRVELGRGTMLIKMFQVHKSDGTDLSACTACFAIGYPSELKLLKKEIYSSGGRAAFVNVDLTLNCNSYGYAATEETEADDPTYSTVIIEPGRAN